MVTPEAVEAELDRIYGLPLDAFVRERDALAAALRKAGDKARAAEVKALTRPTVPAWAVNRLWRAARKDFDALLEAGEAMRGAQRHALSGGGGGELKQALAKRRTAAATLMAKARDVLEEGGHAASAATLQRVEAALHALATMGDPPGLGRMAGDVEAFGLEGLLGLGASFEPAAVKKAVKVDAPKTAPAPAPAKPAHDDKASRERERVAREAAKRAVTEAKVKLADAETAAAKAARESKQAEARRAEGKAAVSEAEEAVKAAERDVKDARTRLEDQKQAAKAAEHEATAAERAADHATRARDRAAVDHQAAVAALDKLR